VASFTHSYRVDLSKSIKTEQLQTVLTTSNSNAHRIQAEVYKDGDAVNLRGTVTGTVQRADGTTVVVGGARDGNLAYILLPAAAYAIPGRVIITLKSTDGAYTTTLLYVGATVSQSSTGEWIDPGHVVPDVEAVVAQTAAAQQAAQAANDAAEFLTEVVALEFSPSTNYAKGAYCIKDGLFYRFTAAHTAGAWNANHVVRVYVGDELRLILADAVFEPMAIQSMSISPEVAEKGSTVTSVDVTFTLNKLPNTLKVDGTTITPIVSGAREVTGSWTSTKSFSVVASDIGSLAHSPTTATELRALMFFNRIYYGVSAGAAVDGGDFITTVLQSVISETKARTFTVNATSGKYIWYALPSRLGTCTFKVGGFDGGFEDKGTVQIVNQSGYQETYRLYASTNAGLGSTTVTVN